MSGSRFYVLKGRGARLQRALISWMLDFHQSQNGYTEIYPPFVVKREALVGSAQLPKFADNVYHDEQDDLWLVPTAEVPLTNMHRDEILDANGSPHQLRCLYALFPPGEDVGGQGHPRHQARPPV